MRSYLFIVLFFLLTTSGIGQSDNKSKYRWLVSADVPILYNLYNVQYGSSGETFPLGKDWNNALGVILNYYSAEKASFFSLNPKVNFRNTLYNFEKVSILQENSLVISGTYNYLIINKTPSFLQITKFFVGTGISYNNQFSKKLEYFDKGLNFNSDIVKPNRIYALLRLGILEDVFNIDDRTSQSSCVLTIGFPLESLSNNFKSFGSFESQVLKQYHKSRTRRLTLEFSFSHFIDQRKNRFSDYNLVYENKWPEVEDPVQQYAPPIVNHKQPNKNYFGNFFFDSAIYRFQDSIYSNEIDSNLKVSNKLFSSFTVGYTFNFFGNYAKDQSEIKGVGLVNIGTGWRRSLFLSVGLRNNIYKAQSTFNSSKVDVFDQNLVFRGGTKFLNLRSKMQGAIGFSFFHPVDVQTFLNHSPSPYPLIGNKGIIAALGYKNYYFKSELIFNDFKNSKVAKSLTLGVSIGM